MSWFSELTHGRGPLMDAAPVVVGAIGMGVGVPGLGGLLTTVVGRQPGMGMATLPPPPPAWHENPTNLALAGGGALLLLYLLMD